MDAKNYDIEQADAEDPIDAIIEYYESPDLKFSLEQFKTQVNSFFESNPALHALPFPAVHSTKSRLKDPTHLREKIRRKQAQGTEITKDNLLCQITDLAGVRVFHLYQDQFSIIHESIMSQVDKGDWVFNEKPTAYTWDPETQQYFKDLGIHTEIRPTYYTSVHYIVKPNKKSQICCEIQVRTLFEEIWGEIDHAINYPEKTNSIACSEQLRVLSKLVSTGTRLSDSIHRSYQEYQEHEPDT